MHGRTLQSQSLFKQDNTTETIFFKNHIPDHLYKHFVALNLISNKILKFQSEQNQEIIFRIEKSVIENEKGIEGVIINIEHRSKDENISKRISLSSYYFINKNAYWSGDIDEDGLDYVSPHNRYAFLWTDNFLCREETTRFVKAIIDELAKAVPDFAPQPEKYASDCSMM
jgi:hypothetical protein